MFIINYTKKQYIRTNSSLLDAVSVNKLLLYFGLLLKEAQWSASDYIVPKNPESDEMDHIENNLICIYQMF